MEGNGIKCYFCGIQRILFLSDLLNRLCFCTFLINIHDQPLNFCQKENLVFILIRDRKLVPPDINFPTLEKKKLKNSTPTIFKIHFFIFDNGFLTFTRRFSNVTANSHSHRRQCVTTQQIVRRGTGTLTTIIIGSISSNSIINIIIIASRVQNK